MKIFAENELDDLCHAISQLERMGLKYRSDFGYENAIDKYNSLKKKKWVCPVCGKTYGEEIQSFDSGFQGCCGKGLDQIK